MASYHVSVKAHVSRSKGQSAVAKAAYNARDSLVDERDGLTKDYRRAGGVLFSGIFAPKDAPEWVRDRGALWNAAERAEKRNDARTAQEIMIALPHELSDEQRRFLITDFAREQFARRGIVADVNIHAPDPKGDGRNYHAHVLLALREVGPDGFEKRLPERTPEQINQWRAKFAEQGAKALERAGFPLEAGRFAVGHLTLSQQREAALQRGDLEWAAALDREPTKHRGPTIDAMERRGIVTDRAQATLGKDAAAIRMAYSLSDSGPAFVAALREQGLTLACVTMSDTLQHQQTRADHQAAGKTAPRWLEIGELVAVDQRGRFHSLDERTTGDRGPEIQKYLAAVDRAELPSAYDAQRQHAQQDRVPDYVSRVEARRDSGQDDAAQLKELRTLQADVAGDRQRVRHLLEVSVAPEMRDMRAELRELEVELRNAHIETRLEIRALEGPRPIQKWDAERFDELRELRSDISVERGRLAELLRDETLTPAARTELQTTATELRFAQSDIRSEIFALEREQPRDEKRAVSVERKESTAALTAAVVGTAARALDLVGETAGKAIESVGDMFGASAPTPEMIAAREAAWDEAAAQREAKWEDRLRESHDEHARQHEDRRREDQEQEQRYYDRGKKRGDRER